MAFVYQILPLLSFLISIFLAGLVLRSSSRDPNYRLFAFFLTAQSLWGFTIFGMRSSPSLALAYEWEKAALVAIMWVSILFYHFTIRLVRYQGIPWALGAFYVLAGVVDILVLLGQVATGMQLKFYGYAPVVGPAFPLYMAVGWVPTVLALFILLRAHGPVRRRGEKTRIEYVVVGAAASLLGGTSDALPALGLNIYPLGILANILFAVLTTIAMTRHNLMDLAILLRKGLAYFLISTAIFAVYGVIFLAFLLVVQQQTSTATVLATIAALLLVAIFLPPTVNKVQRLVDRLFFRERYDYLVALERFSQETPDITDFKGLSRNLIRTAALSLQAAWVRLVLPDPASGEFRTIEQEAESPDPELALPRTSVIVQWLARPNGALTPAQWPVDSYLQAMGEKERQWIANLGGEVLVPMKARGDLTGILVVGPRISGEEYSEEEIRLLLAFCGQAAMAVENARLYSYEAARLRELEEIGQLKSTLLRTVAHELKSPLTAIRTSVDLLFSTNGLREESKARLIRALRNGVFRLERLVAESLDYAQMQTAQLELNLEPIQVQTFLDDVVGYILPATSAKNQALTVKVAEDLPVVLLDRARMERVLLNLLSNANKFSAMGSSIAVSASAIGENIVIDVSDTGYGMHAEDLQFLFTEFFRGRRGDSQQNAGTGLGLSISKYLVELHGGKIQVESVLGKGTTFYIFLPLRRAIVSQLPEASSVSAIE